MNKIVTYVLASLVMLSCWSAAAQRSDNYCSMFDGESILFLIDRTEQYDEIDKELITNAAGRLFGEIAPGSRVIIHTITDDFATSRKLLDSCMPGCPETGGFWDEIWKSCSEIRARRDATIFRKEFAEKLLDILNSEEKHSGSAIIETINSLVAQYSDTDLENLVIFSDLLENSSLAHFVSMSGSQFKELYARLVEMHMLPRSTDFAVTDFGFGRMHGAERKGLDPQKIADIRDFWILYFTALGASEIEIGQRYE